MGDPEHVAEPGDLDEPLDDRARVAEMHLAACTPKLMLVDSDGTVGTLFRFHGECDDRGNVIEQSSRGVATFGLNADLDGRDQLVNRLLKRGAEFMV